jgi:hypothetical protein
MDSDTQHVENPFIAGPIKKMKIENDIVILDKQNIKEYFSCIYILCIKDDYKIPYEFFLQSISYELLLEVYSHLLIIKAPIRMLKNPYHFNSIIILSDAKLQLCNIFKYSLESKNIVLPFFTINYFHITPYINQYYKYLLTDLINIIKLNQNFNYNTSNLRDLISKISESTYWTKGIPINFTNAFINRRFLDKRKIKLSAIENYVGFTQNINIEKKPIDNYTFKSKKHYTEHASKNIPFKIKTSNLTFDKINELFNSLSKNNQELLFMHLIASKKHAYLVLNNNYILTLLSLFIQENKTLKYLLSYAWITFYLEECIQGNKIKITDRFIFSVDIASKLPYFTFDYADPKDNPYMPLLFHDLEYGPDTFYSVNERFIHTGGVCNLETFIKRILMFLTGDPNNNIFAGLDFKENDICITGSIIAACGPKNIHMAHNQRTTTTVVGVPRVFTGATSATDTTSATGATSTTSTTSCIKTPKTDDELFKEFLKIHYSDSDVDMIIKNVDITTKEGYTKFVNTVKIIHDTIKVKYIETELILTPLNYLFVSKKHIEEHISLDGNISNKINHIYSHINEPEIINKFKPLYEQLKAQRRAEFVHKYSIEEITKWEEQYPDMLNNNTFKICISTNTTDSYSLVFTCKAHITSSGLSRKLEIFSIKEDDFFSVVSTFHFPCVRGIYDGSNVYLMPSCITAFMTLMNIDYKYVCCAKDPIELILKYKDFRGYGIYLNIDEKKSVIKYIMKNQKYWPQYNIDNTDTYQSAYSKIFKSVNILSNGNTQVMNSFGNRRAIDKYGNITPLDIKVI